MFFCVDQTTNALYAAIASWR